jgi:alpha-D-xyloside xylohydrolase
VGCRARTTGRPEEALAVAQNLRERRIPCDVLTLDGRAAWRVETRFRFRVGPERFPIPRRARAIREQTLRVCVWEYPYVSCTRACFRELAQRGFLLTHAQRRSVRLRVGPRPRHEPFGDVSTPLPDSGIVDFTNPAAFAWWRDAHRALFADGVGVIKSDFGEHVPDDAVELQRRLGPALPQRLSAAVQPVRLRGDARVPARGRGRRWCGAARLDRQPALSHRLGRRSAERLGGPCRIAARRTVVGDERQPVSQLRHWRLLRRDATVGRAVPCVGCKQPSSARISACMGIGEREPWIHGPEVEAICRKWLAFRYRLIPYPRP